MKKISRKLWYVLLMVIVISGMLLFIPGSLYACNPGISLTKTADPTSITQGFASTITYTYTVTNTGDVALDVNVVDSNSGIGIIAVGALAPKAIAIVTKTYTVTPADTNDIVNTAEATGTYIDVGVKEVKANAGATVTVTAPTLTEEVLPAPIAPIYYMVTFDKNNLDVGSTDANPVSIAGIAYNATVTLPAQPTRTDYTFTGWNTAPAGSGTAFDAATAVTANITVYAQWTTAITVKAITEKPASVKVKAITEEPAEEVIEVAAITEEVIEVAAITELPRTGNNMLFYVIGFALMAVGVAFGSFFIPKALRKREN